MTVRTSGAACVALTRTDAMIRQIPMAASIAVALTLAVWLGVRPASGEPLVYIPLGSEDKIVVIDAASDTIVGEIGGIVAVHGLAATPNRLHLVAGSYEERPVGGTAPARPAGVSASEHAAHHAPPEPSAGTDGEAMVSTVSVIRADDGEIVRAIDVPGAVHHVAVSADGRYAVVTRPNEGEMSAIDLATFEVVANVATGSLPNYAAFSRDGARLFVSNAGDATISVVDVDGWFVESQIAVGSSPEHIVVSRDGGTLYVNNVNDGTVSVLDLASGGAMETISVGDTLHGIDLSEDGAALFVASLGDDTVARIDLATGNVTTVKPGPAPYHLATIAGSGKIYVSSSDTPTIWVIDQARLEVIGQIDIGGTGHQMVAMPGS